MLVYIQNLYNFYRGICMAKLINATEVRNNFNELVNRAGYGKERLIITHHNNDDEIYHALARLYGR